MTAALLTALAWLPPAPADFRGQVRAIGRQSSAGVGRQIRFLANHALDINQSTALARAIDRLPQRQRDAVGFKPLRLALISNSTSSLVGPVLKVAAARHGFLLELVETDYGQAVQEALNPKSSLHQAQPEFVLLAIDRRDLPLRCTLGDDDEADAAIARSLDYLRMIREGVESGCGATIIFETVTRPAELLFGSLDLRIAGTPRSLLDRFNKALAAGLRGTPHLLLDTAALAETIGLANWDDPRQWHLAKLPFAPELIPLYADHVGRLLAAARGKSRRCLVLDLDNTLWGGIIGDDGLSGIVIGQGSAAGEAHLDVQSTAMTLRDRGIVLAVSSKNEEATARAPFLQHPDMLLRENHIAVFQANWKDKAANIRAIADVLALGPESLVLLDDNPAERAQVRRELPEVAVPELPDDPALFPRVLLASGYFEAIAFSAEDRARAEYYQANATRAVLLEGSSNLDEFLASLDTTITFSPFDEVGQDRIVQLINKSNQFNLTTRRYAAADLKAMAADPGVFTLQVRLADRFGDNGMICAIICRALGDTWDVDTWLMSCRVLGRKVERAVLQEIIRNARLAGASRLRGLYIPTDRNMMVKDHYAALGFEAAVRHPDGSSEWILRLNEFTDAPLPLQVRRLEGAASHV
jgi:FkbH-like protein